MQYHYFNEAHFKNIYITWLHVMQRCFCVLIGSQFKINLKTISIPLVIFHRIQCIAALLLTTLSAHTAKRNFGGSEQCKCDMRLIHSAGLEEISKTCFQFSRT